MLTRRAAVPLLPLLAIAMPLTSRARLDLTALDRDMAGPRARVLTLGTTHLRTLLASFDPAALDDLLDRLAAFRPEIVTIETENGEECDLAARHPARYGADYCPSIEAARKATGLDAPAAMAAAHTLLEAWPVRPTPAQRRHLAALFLASYNRAPDLLPLYRAINDPQRLRVLAEANVAPMMQAPFERGYPRIWVAGREIRNLRMVANVRERPGARVPAVVGASHKPWFDSWPGMLQGVEIVDALKVLE